MQILRLTPSLQNQMHILWEHMLCAWTGPTNDSDVGFKFIHLFREHTLDTYYGPAPC
jgi:hypothetical protein